MAGPTAGRDEDERAGAFALLLLSAPLKAEVLLALRAGPRPLIELRRAVGSPPQTTLRGHLRTLAEVGAVERLRQSDFPGSVEYALTAPGHDLLRVADVLAAWLDRSPDGGIELGTLAARSAIKALVSGWSSAIVRALAGRSLSLTELNRLISSLNYPSLERRLGALRLAGQIEARPGPMRGTPYGASEWLRRSVAPIAAAMRWERRHLPAATPPVGRIDAEAALLLAVPLLTVPSELSGICRLAVAIGNGAGERRLAGVMVEVRNGAVRSCTSRLEGRADAWATGALRGWVGAIVDDQASALEIGGERALALALVEGLHGTLFRGRVCAGPSAA